MIFQYATWRTESCRAYDTLVSRSSPHRTIENHFSLIYQQMTYCSVPTLYYTIEKWYSRFTRLRDSPMLWRGISKPAWQGWYQGKKYYFENKINKAVEGGYRFYQVLKDWNALATFFCNVVIDNCWFYKSAERDKKSQKFKKGKGILFCLHVVCDAIVQIALCP